MKQTRADLFLQNHKVPIEINEPPVYLKGKPKYVTVYRPAPAPVATPPPPPPPQPSAQIYHMPVYSPTYAGHYAMPDPMSMYAPMLPPAGYPAAMGHMGANPASMVQSYAATGSDANQLYKQPEQHDSSFTDYDDDFGNYYVRAAASKMRNVYSTAPQAKNPKNGGGGAIIKRLQQHQLSPFKRRLEDTTDDSWFRQSDDQESIDASHDAGLPGSGSHKRRVRRQAPNYYQQQAGYEREPPCYGFPLEVNIKSRVKMDRLFPIFGNSQHKKCIKVGRPLLPPPDHHGDHIHVLQKVY